MLGLVPHTLGVVMRAGGEEMATERVVFGLNRVDLFGVGRKGGDLTGVFAASFPAASDMVSLDTLDLREGVA